MPSIDGPVNPVQQAHKSRRGRQGGPAAQRHVSLADRDVSTVLQEGFLPADGALGDLAFPGLSKMRDEHQRHLRQVAAAQREGRKLTRKFEDEDLNHERALRGLYASGEGKAVKDHRTPAAERERLIADADEKVRIAWEVAREWAAEALENARLRSQRWEVAILERQGAINAEIEKLNAKLTELRNDLLTDEHIKTWLKRLNAPNGGMVMRFSDLEQLDPPADPEESARQFIKNLRPGMTIGA